MSAAATPDGGRLAPTAALSRFAPDPPAATTPGPGAGDRARYGFRVGALGLLIPPDTLCEVVQHAAVFPVPKTPEWVRGLMNLRGSLVPVFDLHRYLGIEPGERLLLALGTGPDLVGLYAQGLPERVAEAAPAAQLPPLPGRLRGFVQGARNRGGTAWLEVGWDGLFTAMGTG